jgi:hypothetical protein
MFSGAAIIRLSEPLDVKKLASALPEIPITESTYGGQAYHRVWLDQVGLGFYMPDDRTVIAAMEATLFQFISRSRERKTDHPWAKAWASVADAPFAVAADVGFFRATAEPLLLGAGGVIVFAAPFAPLWEDTTVSVLGVRLDEGLTIDSAALCGDDEAAGRVEDTSRALLTLVRNGGKSGRQYLSLLGAGQVKSEAERETFRSIERAIDVAYTTAKDAKVEREGRAIRFHARAGFDLAVALQTLASWAKK